MHEALSNRRNLPKGNYQVRREISIAFLQTISYINSYIMKDGYIPKDKRKKILLMCDDIRVHSGIAHMGRELVINTAHHFNWVNVGGAVKHPEAGQRFDLSV